MSVRSSRRAGRAFTLIEVMVAIAVLSMVSISIWAATSQTARTRDVVSESHEMHHQIRIAFELFTRDISSAFLSLHRAQLEPTHDTIFLGRDHGSDDRVDFAAFTHQRRYFDVNESDQCEIAYFLADDPDISGQMNLVRRESPILDLEPLEGGQYLVLVEDVAELDIQYFDMAMNEWQDEWDTTEVTGSVAMLPHQVRIRLVIFDAQGDKVTYGTQVAIPMRSAILRAGFVPGPPLTVTY